MKDKLLEIFYTYDRINQRKKLAEECMELQDEIFMSVHGMPENILTELADVIVLTLQFMADAGYDFDLLEENLKSEINFKINRQINRIENKNVL